MTANYSTSQTPQSSGHRWTAAEVDATRSNTANINTLEQADQEWEVKREKCAISDANLSNNTASGSECICTPGSLSNAALVTRVFAEPTRLAATCASTRAWTPTPWYINRRWSCAYLRKAVKRTTCAGADQQTLNATGVTKRSQPPNEVVKHPCENQNSDVLSCVRGSAFCWVARIPRSGELSSQS